MRRELFRKNPTISGGYENAAIIETKRQVSCTIVQETMATPSQYSLKCSSIDIPGK
jgi:hypothetical protein